MDCDHHYDSRTDRAWRESSSMSMLMAKPWSQEQAALEIAQQNAKLASGHTQPISPCGTILPDLLGY